MGVNTRRDRKMSISRARALRGNPPEPERQMWRILYALRQQGYHFRRQAQIWPYYADFACLHAHLMIEADGGTHAAALGEEHDRRRDSYLRSRGFRILRFWNGEIMDNPDSVFQAIATMLETVPPLTPTCATGQMVDTMDRSDG